MDEIKKIEFSIEDDVALELSEYRQLFYNDEIKLSQDVEMIIKAVVNGEEKEILVVDNNEIVAVLDSSSAKKMGFNKKKAPAILVDGNAYFYIMNKRESKELQVPISSYIVNNDGNMVQTLEILYRFKLVLTDAIMLSKSFGLKRGNKIEFDKILEKYRDEIIFKVKNYFKMPGCKYIKSRNDINLEMIENRTQECGLHINNYFNKNGFQTVDSHIVIQEKVIADCEKENHSDADELSKFNKILEQERKENNRILRSVQSGLEKKLSEFGEKLESTNKRIEALNDDIKNYEQENNVQLAEQQKDIFLDNKMSDVEKAQKLLKEAVGKENSIYYLVCVALIYRRALEYFVGVPKDSLESSNLPNFRIRLEERIRQIYSNEEEVDKACKRLIVVWRRTSEIIHPTLEQKELLNVQEYINIYKEFCNTLLHYKIIS